MIGAEVPGVFVNVMRGGPGLGQHRARAGRHQAGLPRPRPRQHPRHRARALHAAGDARPHDAGLRAGLQVPQPGRDPRRRLPRPDDGQGGAAADDASSRACPTWAVWGDRPTAGNLISLDPPRRARPRGPQPAPQREVRGDDRGRAAGRPLPLRRRRGPARGLQHAGADGQGRGRDAAAAGGQGRPLPADHALALPDRRPAPAAAEGRAARRGRGQRAARGRAAARPLEGGPARRRRSTHVRHQGGVLPQQEEIVAARPRRDRGRNREEVAV